ncbi:MAG: hypothetical protein NTY19_19705, partial [Planctomycetota bacterium]|nr:hypothetical protein [Planctomycetota bacterium]
ATLLIESLPNEDWGFAQAQPPATLTQNAVAIPTLRAIGCLAIKASQVSALIETLNRPRNGKTHV